MATKTISIREDVYNMLKNLKKGEESFSDVIDKLTKRKSGVREYFGVLKGSRALDDVEEDCRKMRAAARHRI